MKTMIKIVIVSAIATIISTASEASEYGKACGAKEATCTEEWNRIMTHVPHYKTPGEIDWGDVEHVEEAVAWAKKGTCACIAKAGAEEAKQLQFVKTKLPKMIKAVQAADAESVDPNTPDEVAEIFCQSGRKAYCK